MLNIYQCMYMHYNVYTIIYVGLWALCAHRL